MIRFNGRDWHPQVFAVCMAYDALRIALGGKPSNFTAVEVIAWLKARSALSHLKEE